MPASKQRFGPTLVKRETKEEESAPPQENQHRGRQVPAPEKEPEPRAYEARFRQPRGHLNRLGVTMRAEIGVRVFACNWKATTWGARYIGGANLPGPAGGELQANTAEGIKIAVGNLFDEITRDWEPVK